MPRATLARYQGRRSPPHNAAALQAVLAGAKNAYRDIAVLNAAAALVVAGKAADLHEGAVEAEAALDAAGARPTLEKLIKVSHDRADSVVAEACAD